MTAAKAKTLKFDFEVRKGTGKGVCRKLRGSKRVPVVLYGQDFKEGLAGIIDGKTIAPIANSARRESTVVELVVDGKGHDALIRDVQRHPISQQILHIDFIQVIKGQKVKVEIPVVVTGKEACPGIKEGGVLEQPARFVMIDVLPKDIPEQIVVDISELALGSELFVKDLALPAGAEWITDAEHLVLRVAQTRSTAIDEAVEGEETPAAEVEVVAKGKKEEEE